MNDYDDRSAPCPVCGSTQLRGGFCCESCHASYMSQQHDRWSQPATGMSRKDDFATVWGWSSQASGFARPEPRSARRDPCWETDEQVGSWSRGVRAMEDAD